MIILLFRKMNRIINLIFFCVLLNTIPTEVIGAEDSKNDLRNEWMIYEGGEYKRIPSNKEFDAQVIYIKLDLQRNTNSILEITSPRMFSVFIDAQISGTAKKSRQISLDSIRQQSGASSALIAIFQKEGISSKQIHTQLLSQKDAAELHEEVMPRVATYFRDFVITGVVGLLILLILVIAQNPKLASDYFSILKLFSISGSQDHIGESRTSSSSNILFQSFCSILFGFLLTILMTHVQDGYSLANIFRHQSYGEALWVWLLLSLIVFVVLLVKQVVIYLLAHLFGAGDLAATHYFNLIRLLFWVLGISSAFISIYLITHGERYSVFESLYISLSWFLVLWVVLIFFKLSRQVNFSMFHLFSYLCATEIVPLIITIKVLYY